MLSVVYVIFTEGSTATSGDDLIRPDLAYEAIRLARVLARLVPDEPEVHGLLALLELTAARFPARTGPDGEPVLLADQDRRRWDLAAIRRGPAALAQAGRVGRGLGAYGLQAAIAECHAVAPSVDGDRLGADRGALRGARPAGALAGRRAQPGRRASRWPRARPPALRGRRRAGRRRAARRLAPAAERARRAADPARAATDEAQVGAGRAPSSCCGNARERAVLERKLRR